MPARQEDGQIVPANNKSSMAWPDEHCFLHRPRTISITDAERLNTSRAKVLIEAEGAQEVPHFKPGNSTWPTERSVKYH